MKQQLRWISTCVLWLHLMVVAFALPAPAQEDMSDEDRKNKVDAMYAEYKKKFPAVMDIAPADALRARESDKIVFVDVREPEEQSISMIPGAITAETFLDHPDRYREYRIIGYCTISYRSGKLAQKLKKRGIDMINLHGGILMWLHDGGTIIDAEGRRTYRVHVYGTKWDLAPAAYETVH